MARLGKEYREAKTSDYYKQYRTFFAATTCFSDDERIPKPKYISTMFTYGTPLVPTKLSDADEGKKDADRAYPTDTDALVAFLTDVISHVEEKFVESDTGVKVRIDGFILAIDDFINLALSDALKALFSLAFVFLYLNFHLQSCCLSGLGMGIIVLSFPFTVIITNGILQVKYFGFLQIMIIYIVLGIAADDIFVFYDAY